MFKNDSYLLYMYISKKTGENYLVLSSKTWDRYIVFTWGKTSAQVKELIDKFETVGLENSDFEHHCWTSGDVLRNMVGKHLELLSC